tara:strand:- start:4264 stop:4386 length:123 start_codon:yes stop_codon:yes gene_type:complete
MKFKISVEIEIEEEEAEELLESITEVIDLIKELKYDNDRN